MPRGILPRGTVFWSALFLLALYLPAVTDFGDAFLNTCVLFGVYAALNLMWALVMGTAGIYSFATLAIAGVSGYGAGYAAIELSLPWPAMLAAGAIVGVVVGLLVALPALRLRGVYFALLTFGLVELARSFVVQSKPLGLAQGLYGAPTFAPESLSAVSSGLVRYYAALALVIVALIVYAALDRGRVGTLLRTARGSEPFARGLGIGVVRIRLVVLVVSSAMIGFTGACYLAFFGGISPTIFSFDTLLLLFAMMVVGGIGSARGVLLGTALLLFIDQQFLDAGALRLIAAGVVMLVVTLVTSDGLAGLPAQLRERRAATGSLPTQTEMIR